MDVPTPIKDTIFGTAWLAGANEWTPAGPLVTWYPDLEISHVLASLRHHTYTDEPGARLRRHVLVYGPSGWRKTSSVNRFVEDAIGAQRYGSTEIREVKERRGERPPVSISLGGKFASVERLIGGASNGRVVRPVFKEVDYLLAGELFSFLGNDKGGQKDMIDVIGQMLEEGKVDRTLFKLVGLEIEENEREQLEAEGIRYDTDAGVLSYDATATMFGATRYMNPWEKRSLEESGFDDRFFFSTWRPTKEDVRTVWKARQEVDAVNFAKLARFNDKLWHTYPGEVNAPPLSMSQAVLTHADDVFEEIEDEMGIDAHEVRSGRDHGVADQLLTAAAWERTVRTLDQGHYVDRIDYHEEDLDVAAFFFRAYVNHRYEECLGNVKADGHADKDIQALMFLHKEIGDTMTSKQMVKKMALAGNLASSRSTTHRMIKRCVERGWLQRVGHAKSGTYEVSKGAKILMESANPVRIVGGGGRQN